MFPCVPTQYTFILIHTKKGGSAVCIRKDNTVGWMTIIMYVSTFTELPNEYNYFGIQANQTIFSVTHTLTQTNKQTHTTQLTQRVSHFCTAPSSPQEQQIQLLIFCMFYFFTNLLMNKCLY